MTPPATASKTTSIIVIVSVVGLLVLATVFLTIDVFSNRKSRIDAESGKAGELPSRLRRGEESTIGVAAPSNTSPSASALDSVLQRAAVENLEPVVRQQFESAFAAVEAQPADAEAIGRLGMLYHTYSMSALAATCYARAIDNAADSWKWRYLRAVVAAERGDLDGAATGFESVLDERPADVPARMRLAEIRRLQGNFDVALQLLEQLSRERFNDAHVFAAIGQVHLARDEVDLAIEAFARAITIEAIFGRARHGLGQALRRAGLLDESAQQLTIAAEQSGMEPLREDPLMAEVEALKKGAIDSLHRAIALMQAGAVDQAIPLLQEAAQLEPNLAEAHSQLGAAWLLKNDLDQAEQSLRRAIELQPQYVDAMYSMGLVEHRRNELAAAAEWFAAVVNLRPDHFEAQLGLGMDLAELGETARARPALQAAIDLRPDDPRPVKRLARLLTVSGDEAEALAVLRRAVQRMPSDASLADRLAFLLATARDESIRDPLEAISIASDVCDRTDFRIPAAVETLAAAFQAAGRSQEARTALERGAEAAEQAGDAGGADRLRKRAEALTEGGNDSGD